MNKSEILFLYDIHDANPNGDPLDSNKPRLDEETEFNIVTDVRLKRTIRDYLKDFKEQEIFIKDVRNKDGSLQDAKQRALTFKNNKDLPLEKFKEEVRNKIINGCIDVRLFGATIPLERNINNKEEKSSITLTGPVQFRMGRSLHNVELKHIKGTGGFASGEDKDQKTFREEYVLPYSLVNFYGIINGNVAEDTKMSEADLKLLMEGIWLGTKNLITRSKFGQMPRLLLRIEYSEPHFFIGDLNNKISLSHDLDDDKKLRNISECKIIMDNLIKDLESNSSKIRTIYYKIDDNLSFKYGDNILNKRELITKLKSIEKINVEEISF